MKPTGFETLHVMMYEYITSTNKRVFTNLDERLYVSSEPMCLNESLQSVSSSNLSELTNTRMVAKFYMFAIRTCISVCVLHIAKFL
jgi:hypothetical protein